MNPSHLQQWISHPEELNKETLYELRTLLARYPYCQTLRLLYLKNLYLLHDVTFGAELRKSAFYVADRRVLFYLIEGDKYRLPKGEKELALVQEMKEEPGLDRTLSLIDAFLSSTVDDNPLENNFDYALDYTAYLMEDLSPKSSEEEAEIPRLRGQELIDEFITGAENDSSLKLRSFDEEEEMPVEQPDISYSEEDEDDSFFTETLAKIYIKQQRYSKALEIIKKLSLKYPKKNIYFADQIRFLEKLIINNKSK